MTHSKPSKSEQKRAQQAVQKLGEQLIGLDDDVLRDLALDERLLDAIHDARKMKSREALRRHKQYIGKLMRDVDPAPIHAVLDRIKADDLREKRVFADAERWRDRLFTDRSEALAAFAAETGSEVDELAELLVALSHVRSDKEEKPLLRQIFRHIHAMLAGRARDR